MPAQRLGSAEKGCRGSHALDKTVDPAAGLFPDLLAQKAIGCKLVGIVELIGPESAGLFLDQPGRRDHVAGQFPGHAAALAGHDLELRAQDAHVVELLAREGVGRDDMKRVALHRTDQRERYAGAAAGIFDHAAAGRQPPIRLGRLDHGERHAVLHAAGRVLVLKFQQDAAAAGRPDTHQRQQGGMADAVEDCGHELFLCIYI